MVHQNYKDCNIFLFWGSRLLR